MKQIVMALSALTLSIGAASAQQGMGATPQEPTGEWMVEEGYARVRIENCSGRLWGVVAWEKTPGGVDRNNPDTSKRSRPTLGLPILLDMKPGKDRWDGEIYNTEDGRTYTANIKLLKPDVLRVEGCVLGFLCGGQSWTRYRQPPDVKVSLAPPKEFCSKLSAVTGLAH